MISLERAERRMRQRWFDLALAESQGQAADVLRQRYERYIEALQTYMATFEAQRTAFDADAHKMAS